MNAADVDSRAPFTERLRYLATFAEHVVLAAALRSVPRPPPRQRPRESPLNAVFLSCFPPSHLGTVSRLTRWVPHLRRLGCEVEVLTPCSDAEYVVVGRGDAAAELRYYDACLRNQWHNVRRAARADAVFLHRGLLPFTPWQRPTFELLLARLNQHLVYDFYDAIWLAREQASQQSSRAAKWLHPANKVEEIMRVSRVVTVSNDPLAQWARRVHADVRIVPMLLDVGDFRPRRHERRSPVILGWMGSHYQLPRLLSLAPSLRRLAAQREIVLRVICSEEVQIEGVPVESQTHPWSPESDARDLAGLDIGLLPLENIAHDRGKSPFKLLQYCAAGLAVVATPVAIDLMEMEPGECFLPATSEQEWLDAMVRLVDDASLRQRIGTAARDAVERHHSFESHARGFYDALLTAAGPFAGHGG